MNEKEQKILAGRCRPTRETDQPKSAAARGSGVSAPNELSQVGYRSPPKHSRWKRGQSGNPSGRPKGSKSFASLVRETARLKITNPSDGRRYSLSELIVRRLFSDAARGDIAAIRLALSQISRDEETVSTMAPGRLPAKNQDLQAIRELLQAQLSENVGEDDNDR
jgi:hypothetical protein